MQLDFFRTAFAVIILFVASAGAAEKVGGEKVGPPSRVSAGPLLERRLLEEHPESLAADARRLGDPARGAFVFHQPALGCARCHWAEGAELPPGPELTAKTEEEAAAAHLVDSVLRPSKAIRKGYETLAVLTRDNVSLVGLLVEESEDELVLRDAGQDFKTVRVAKSRIRERAVSPESIMPASLAHQLSSRGDFLDLVRYLMDVAEKGPARALELRPPAALLSPPPLPEYEKEIDHARLIRGLDAGSFRRGAAIYDRLCVNCHGTKKEPGSLPTSLRFASGTFKNGSDPFRMYQTLTRGFAMMTPQGWMVPREKYDAIHYIREEYLKKSNPSQYAAIDDAYLKSLPNGTNLGPEPSPTEPWVAMDYGPSMMGTFEVGDDGSNIACKGFAVRLDEGRGGIAAGRQWMLYDLDTLRAVAAWSGEGFIDWNGIHFNGRHAVHPRIAGRVHFSNPRSPGWANPENGRWEDPRLQGRDGRRFGPLPRAWAHYKGVFHHGGRAILSYTVGDARILEMPGVCEGGPHPVYTRTLQVGPRTRELEMAVARIPAEAADKAVLASAPRPGLVLVNLANSESGSWLAAGLTRDVAGAAWSFRESGSIVLKLPRGSETLRFTVWISAIERQSDAGRVVDSLSARGSEEDLETITRGGPARWAASLATRGRTEGAEGPFAVDVLSHPAENPWNAQMRFTGLDFLPANVADPHHAADSQDSQDSQNSHRAAVSTWDGDVWIVDGIDAPERGLTWRRIASGLFQPLGLKVLRGAIHVSCRDQIAVLRDLNGDGETDFYESFNNDHQVTEHFHEFAMDLQADAEGNLYYAKGARHAKTALVLHHGTLLRVSKDGSRTDILATGFRAPNGVCLNPDGTFFLTDQEGHWTPKNRINHVRIGGYYGNFWGYHGVTDPSDAAMEPPVCWITNEFDRSPAELLWVPRGAWGLLEGSLINLSYGQGKVFIVLHETVKGRMQGAMAELPIPTFPTGVMRGRFHPKSGDLYLCGMFAWAGNREQPGGFYRVRYAGKPLNVPVEFHACRGRLAIRFSDPLFGPLDGPSAADPRRYGVKVWSLRRSADYGSPHIGERALAVAAARLEADGRTVVIEIPALEPVQGLEVRYSLKGTRGEPVQGTIHGTIHELGE